jgi:PBP1b-binding outer membrane lipoprotein LpoB
MKYAFALVMAILVSAVLISGCTNQPGSSANPATGPSAGAQLTQSEKESQAATAVEQEMNQAIENMTMQEIENELLVQG